MALKENNEIKNEATGDELTDKLAKMFDESSDTELVNSIMEDIDGLQSDDFDEDEKIEEADVIEKITEMTENVSKQAKKLTEKERKTICE